MTDYYVMAVPSSRQLKKGIRGIRKIVKSKLTARKMAVKFIDKDPNAYAEIYDGDYVGYRQENLIYKIQYLDKQNAYFCDIIKDKKWDGFKTLNQDGSFQKRK